jgi:arylsulfatase A-like enzyme
MHHLCLVRGVNTSEDDHGKGAYLMLTGRRQTPAADYPRIGAVAAKALAPADSPLPGHIVITPGGGGGSGNDSAYLEPKYASVVLGNGNPPQYTARPEGLAEPIDASRNDFRRRANERFLSRRRTAMTDAYAASYEQALQLMAQREVFDVAKEPAKDQERYGKYDFGRHCLLARRLLEKGITFVQVSHSNYDTHNENFDFHLEQLGEFDLGFSNFVADIADRGMLDSTLIVVLSEFGRTPNINLYYGRDHWSKAWTVVMGGCRTPRGVAYGGTNADGTEVVDGQVDHGNLFHTYLQSVGVDSTGAFNIEGREMPIADPASHAVEELLA